MSKSDGSGQKAQMELQFWAIQFLSGTPRTSIRGKRWIELDAFFTASWKLMGSSFLSILNVPGRSWNFLQVFSLTSLCQVAASVSARKPLLSHLSPSRIKVHYEVIHLQYMKLQSCYINCHIQRGCYALFLPHLNLACVFAWRVCCFSRTCSWIKLAAYASCLSLPSWHTCLSQWQNARHVYEIQSSLHGILLTLYY